LSLRQENPLISEQWGELVSTHPEASIFHGTAWAKVLADTYGFTPVYLTAFCDHHLATALPLLEVDSWLTGKRGVSLPFTDECEALSFTGTSAASLVESALQIGRAKNWRYLELRGGHGLFNDARPSVTFHGHQLNLSASTDSLFGQFDSSVRRAIRKAEKHSLQITFAQTLQATSEYYELHCLTRKEHGLPPQPFKFFRHLHEHMLAKNLGLIVTARLKNTPIASAVFLYQGQSAVYKFGASDPAALETRANNLVMWEGIKWLAAKGIKALRFGRTSTLNEGLRRYKLGWGTTEYTINYYKYDFRAAAVVPVKDESTGWHNVLFRALPRPLARRVGSFLYPHVA